jgi:uncharacterized membrane protein YhaH (DUF805 family)
MNWTWFLFSFEGRINRGKFWLAPLIWFATLYSFMTIFSWVMIGIMLATGIHSVSSETMPWAFFLPGFPLLVIFVWLFAATTIKRLHDRGKSGWWLAVFFLGLGLLGKLSNWLDNGPFAALVSALCLGLSAWCFVELFCLRGKHGATRFGPDPLARVAPPVPVAVVAPAETRPNWDQHSELELVPHRAGPSAGA